MPLKSFKQKIRLCFYCNGTIMIVLLLTGAVNSANDKNKEKYDSCCSFPCQNGGICLTTGYDQYMCDCTSTGYQGQHCEKAGIIKTLVGMIRPRKESIQYAMTHFSWLWAFINRSPLQKSIMKYVYMSRSSMVDTPPKYTSKHSYITLDSYYNASYYARDLPPIPKNCPTPMGVVGKPTLPDIEELVDKMFRRRKFTPCPHRTNVMFATYAQHFTHQFFKTDFERGPEFTWGSEGVDVSHVYGKDKTTQNMLRSFKGGRMKSQIINGEEYPAYHKDAPVEMNYPPTVPEHHKFALGHPFFALLPGLFAYATIWMREHNRVCGILEREHPEWDDERLYQTGRLIIVGETIKITIEDYVQHLSQYNFKLSFNPELVHGTDFQFSNRIRLEFNHLYHWHPLFPDFYNVSSDIYPLEGAMFNVSSVLKHGMTEFINAMVHQRAGKLSRQNHGEILLPIMKSAILHGRTLRVHPFNAYRVRFGLKPYTSFEELTGEKVLAAQLEKMYGSVDAVEFMVGMFVERDGYTVTPRTMVEVGGPYSVKGLIANPICSPGYWKPSTFGGEVGFNIIKTASLQKLFCYNLKGRCPRIAFTVPDYAMDYNNDLEKTEL